MPTPLLSIKLQANRKVLILTDVSTDVWGSAGYELVNYAADNNLSNKVLLTLTIETLDKTITKEINLTAEGAFGIISSPVTKDKLVYSLCIDDTGEIKYVSNTTNLPDTYGVFPDGIYTIKYSIVSLQPIEKSFINVLTEYADNVVIRKAHDMADRLLITKDFNPRDIIDELLYEAMLFAVTKSALIGRKAAILKLLTIINNEDYEYYTNC